MVLSDGAGIVCAEAVNHQNLINQVRQRINATPNVSGFVVSDNDG
jgi:hypothetical protein